MTTRKGEVRGASLAALAFILPSASLAQDAPEPEAIVSKGNPILADGLYYSTDPAPLVVGDTLYILAGRDEAPPKPHPGGLLHLAERWRVAPSELVMVGDYRFDLECAKAAGARSVLVNLPENLWPELTDLHARDCLQLRDMLAG